jgi:hypothetical protein
MVLKRFSSSKFERYKKIMYLYLCTAEQPFRRVPQCHNLPNVLVPKSDLMDISFSNPKFT